MPYNNQPGIIDRWSAFCLMMDCVTVVESRQNLESLIIESRIPWNEIIPDGCSPFLFENMKKAGIADSIPPEIKNKFDVRLIKNTGTNIVRLRELDIVVESLNKLGIEPVLLKGAGLLHTVYEHPGHRGMTDIDILVEPHAMKKASAVFEKLGYKIIGKKGHHISFAAQREFPVLFELHNDLFNRKNPLHKYAYPLRTKDLISRSELFLINNNRARIFEKTDQFLFLCCHTAKEKAGSLKLIADLCVSIEKRCPDWEAFFHKTIEYNTRIPVIIIAYLSFYIRLVGKYLSDEYLIIDRTELKLVNFKDRSRNNLSQWWNDYYYYIKQIQKPTHKIMAIIESPFYFIAGRIQKHTERPDLCFHGNDHITGR